MVHFHAFWVAISYRLWLTVLPESEIRVELKFIGDRFSILGTMFSVYSLLKIACKNDKNSPKITKNCVKIALLFCNIIRICSLKIVEGGGLRRHAPPLTTPLGGLERQNK